MGTRGLMGFVIDGDIKVTYNHWDSYPSALGEAVAAFARSVTDEQRDAVRALRLVAEDDAPSGEDIARLSRFANRNVGSKDVADWYVLLRETQGNPTATLDAGAMIDSKDFAANSLFCEWGYVVDLDADALEVYRGFQTEPHAEGRFASLPSDDTTAAVTGSRYYPIRLIATYPLGEIPNNLGEALDEDD